MRNLLRPVLLAILATGITLPALAQEICSRLSVALTYLDTAKGAPLEASAGVSFESLFDGCDANNRFNGHSPLPGGRKCSTDKNSVEGLLKFPDNTIIHSAKMAVDADGSFAATGDPTGQSATWLTFDAGSDRHYVDAEAVPFVVVPKKDLGTNFQARTGIKKGDLAVIIKGGRCSLGVVGDAGPAFRLGEASVRSHADLGNPQCAVAGQVPCARLRGGGSGVGIGSGVTYILFPGTRPVPLLSQTVVEVTHELAGERALKFLDDYRKP